MSIKVLGEFLNAENIFNIYFYRLEVCLWQSKKHFTMFCFWAKWNFTLNCPGSFKGLYSLVTLRTHTTKGVTFFHIFHYFKLSFTYIYIIGSLITLKHMKGTLQFCAEIRPFLLILFLIVNIKKKKKSLDLSRERILSLAICFRRFCLPQTLKLFFFNFCLCITCFMNF